MGRMRLTEAARGATRAQVTDSGGLGPPILRVSYLKFLRSDNVTRSEEPDPRKNGVDRTLLQFDPPPQLGWARATMKSLLSST